jgi:hypothetical protein
VEAGSSRGFLDYVRNNVIHPAGAKPGVLNSPIQVSLKTRSFPEDSKVLGLDLIITPVFGPPRGCGPAWT